MSDAQPHPRPARQGELARPYRPSPASVRPGALGPSVLTRCEADVVAVQRHHPATARRMYGHAVAAASTWPRSESRMLPRGGRHASFVLRAWRGRARRPGLQPAPASLARGARSARPTAGSLDAFLHTVYNGAVRRPAGGSVRELAT
jgi:hypothetical protein